MAWRLSCKPLSADACRRRRASHGSPSCRSRESRSSYNGLLVFFFITASASLAAYAIHRLASRALRRAPAWDCGFPDARPTTQYTAGSFAQPIRRVFGTVDFPRPRACRHAAARRPAPGAFRWSICMIRSGRRIYLPIADAVAFVADRLNQLQFLTIRRYLSLVFFALVLLLLVLALWP